MTFLSQKVKDNQAKLYQTKSVLNVVYHRSLKKFNIFLMIVLKVVPDTISMRNWLFKIVVKCEDILD